MSEEKKDRLCGYNKSKRPRYFHGMLLDEKDFLAEQGYHMHKRRLLNRMLHGWGVVCGLGLQWKKGKNWIKVMPGLALDCCGNDIWVDQPFTIKEVADLAPKNPSRSKEHCEEPDEAARRSRDYYLCIHYREVPTDPVPVYAAGGDCKEKSCDFSKHKEGYCLRLQEHCPEPSCSEGLLKRFCECCGPEHSCSEPCQPCQPCWEEDCSGLEGESLCQCEALSQFCCKPLPCPECPDCSCGEHCVVLGKIRINAEGCLEGVCINGCRTYVLSARMIQYLITSVFCGVEDWWKVYMPDGEEQALPNASRLVNNPIDALCWLARRLVAEEGEFKKTEKGKECLDKLFKKEEEPKPDFVTANDFKAQIEELSSNFQYQVQAVKRSTLSTTQFNTKFKKYEGDIKKHQGEIKKYEAQVKKYEKEIKTYQGEIKKLGDRLGTVEGRTK